LRDKFIIEISCDYSHLLVLTDAGEVYALGCNRFGQIGCGNNVNQSIPIKVEGFNGEKIVMISCGSHNSMALTESGRVFGWSENSSGQLGNNTTIDAIFQLRK
jgi:alpha-tubulin suppressor-like RCC1 family protein